MHVHWDGKKDERKENEGHIKLFLSPEEDMGLRLILQTYTFSLLSTLVHGYYSLSL